MNVTRETQFREFKKRDLWPRPASSPWCPGHLGQVFVGMWQQQESAKFKIYKQTINLQYKHSGAGGREVLTHSPKFTCLLTHLLLAGLFISMGIFSRIHKESHKHRQA